MPDEPMDKKQILIDAEALVEQSKREGAKLLLPHPDLREAEVDFITQLGGRRSNMYKVYQVMVHEKGLIAMAHGKMISMEEMQECAKYILMYSNSLDAMRSKQIVEILKSGPDDVNPSLLEKALGRFKK